MLKINKPRPNRIKKSLLVGLGAATLVLVGTAAQAVLTGVGGTQSDLQRYVNESAAWSTSAAAFVDVPGATTVPPGATPTTVAGTDTTAPATDSTAPATDSTAPPDGATTAPPATEPPAAPTSAP